MIDGKVLILCVLHKKRFIILTDIPPNSGGFQEDYGPFRGILFVTDRQIGELFFELQKN